MKKKYILLFLVLLGQHSVFSQQFRIKKGIIVDSITVSDSIQESFSLYLPTNFVKEKKWPVLFVFDMKGRGKNALGMFKMAAEEQGYVMAASNTIHDSISLSENMLITNRMVEAMKKLFPIHANRMYVAGFSGGGQFANLVSIFIKDIEGTVSCGASLPNFDLLNSKNPFHFIGVVGKEDYNYPELLQFEKALNRLKFPNQLLVFEGGHDWPDPSYLNRALQIFTLSAMSKGNIEKDSAFIEKTFAQNMAKVSQLVKDKKLFLADREISEILSVYRVYKDLDSLRESRKQLRRTRLYRSLKRDESSALFKESLLKEDYVYYLEEDIATYNFNNLGWWNYQMDELDKFIESDNKSTKEMGARLKGFVNALIEDNIDLLSQEKRMDEEALTLLYMLKTITAPNNYDYYLKVVSLSSKIEDYGTALFYLEEALKAGFKDQEKLYAVEHTALLRIMPKFNKLVAQYLKDARYEIKDE